VRHRNAPRRSLRDLERAVELGGGVIAVADLISARIRSGLITPENGLWAQFFSKPLTPLGAKGPPYCWYPLTSQWFVESKVDDDYRISGRPEPKLPMARWRKRLAQDPRTLVLNQALTGVVGDKSEPAWVPDSRSGWGDDLSPHLRDWMYSRGYDLWSTDDLNHPPYEIQSIGTLWGDQADAVVSRVEAKRDELIRDYVNYLGLPAPDEEAWGSYLEDACYFDLLRSALAGVPEALEVLAYLRVHSTLEYMAVVAPLSVTPIWYWPRPYRTPRGTVPFGLAEHQLVSTLLGGPPL
jgi:hypothetical protein